MQISIPGIRTIAAINADALPSDIRFMMASEFKIYVAAIPILMLHFGKAEFIQEIKGYTSSCSLSFQSLVKLDSSPKAFIIEFRSGEKILIGAAEPPYPSVECSESSADSSSSVKCISYKIKWTGFAADCICRLPSDISHRPL